MRPVPARAKDRHMEQVGSRDGSQLGQYARQRRGRDQRYRSCYRDLLIEPSPSKGCAISAFRATGSQTEEATRCRHAERRRRECRHQGCALWHRLSRKRETEEWLRRRARLRCVARHPRGKPSGDVERDDRRPALMRDRTRRVAIGPSRAWSSDACLPAAHRRNRRHGGFRKCLGCGV